MEHEMKSFDNDVYGSTKNVGRPRVAGLDRRDLIKGSVGIAVTQALGGDAKAAHATRKMALEEHFTTPALAKKYVARPTRSDKLFADIERRLADFDQLRLETMDRAGIDVSVLSVTTPGVQAEADAKTAIALAREANDLLAREVQKRPQRYAGFAHLPMQDASAAAAELQRAVQELGFKGALINGQTNGHYLDADMYLPFGSACRNSTFRSTYIRGTSSIIPQCSPAAPN
jgi:predicted TIM-barrel fold metal-dependent hydrolase